LKKEVNNMEDIQSVFRKIVGQRIQTERKRVGYTQEALGNELGVSFKTISAYETGRIDVPENKIGIMSDLLATKKEYLSGQDIISKVLAEYQDTKQEMADTYVVPVLKSPNNLDVSKDTIRYYTKSHLQSDFAYKYPYSDMEPVVKKGQLIFIRRNFEYPKPVIGKILTNNYIEYSILPIKLLVAQENKENRLYTFHMNQINQENSNGETVIKPYFIVENPKENNVVKIVNPITMNDPLPPAGLVYIFNKIKDKLNIVGKLVEARSIFE